VATILKKVAAILDFQMSNQILLKVYLHRIFVLIFMIVSSIEMSK